MFCGSGWDRFGDPWGTRTLNQLIKSQLLYLIELTGHADELYRKENRCQLRRVSIPHDLLYHLPFLMYLLRNY